MSLGVVGAIAAILADVAILKIGRVFEFSEELLIVKVSEGRNQSPEVMQRFYEGLAILDYKHAALWIGTAGAMSGLLFGLALGLMRQSRGSLVRGAIGGMVLGGVLSACGGLAGNGVGENIVSRIRMEKIEVPVQYAMLLHGTTWLIVGLGIGLGTGLGARTNRVRFAIGSMFLGGIAGAAAGAFYPFLASVAMPFADPSLTIPEGDANRVIWLGLPLVFVGLTLGRRG
ncbi:hypothetical protein [Schlesneria paludicola]|uniref:hypothetical protein n=1 Tax=Schlesneria paludicola TaxID=360056 RepID=UPI00029AB85D|nr:hypothetical protein [Schlesneria paludicola]